MFTKLHTQVLFVLLQSLVTYPKEISYFVLLGLCLLIWLLNDILIAPSGFCDNRLEGFVL